MNFAKFLRILFLQNTSGRLLLFLLWLLNYVVKIDTKFYILKILIFLLSSDRTQFLGTYTLDQLFLNYMLLVFKICVYMSRKARCLSMTNPQTYENETKNTDENLCIKKIKFIESDKRISV